MSFIITMRNLTLILILFLLVACGQLGASAPPSPQPTPAPTLAPTSVPAAALRVGEKRPVELAGAQILSLSPDGRWLAARKDKALCLYDAATLAEQHCAELPDGQFDSRGVAWSPDSTRIALTEDVYRTLVESDLWVMDASTGALTNLTDDGATGSVLKPKTTGADPQFDAVPAWSPDSKTLIFARTPASRDQTALYRVAATGGEAQLVWTITTHGPFALFYGLRWSRDGQHILYTLAHPDADNSGNGVWMVDQDGRNARPVARATDKDLGYPMLIDVTARGDRALIWYYLASQMYVTKPNVSYYALLDLDTGAIEPLKQAAGDAPEFFSPQNAIFSPDGSKLLYSYRDGDLTTRLVVRDLGGGAEQVLLSQPGKAIGASDFGQGLNWSADDTVYAAAGPGSGLLLRLAGQ
jgi:Tol biopolymer transport system component